jgi:hypothetical protein
MYDPHFLDLGITWKRVVSFTPRPLYPWEKALVPIVYEIVWAKSRSARREREKILDLIGTCIATPRLSNA